MNGGLWSVLASVLGGLAMFMLAMEMMTEGLKAFAGGGLRRLLARWTSTPLKGVASGILVTGIVQSSSAVTVATIGFVNAGILTLGQALGVIYGTNVGTTMTAWLVSLVGFGFKVESFALPILAAGVTLHLVSADRRRKGLGSALAGFALFFLGLAILREAFAGIADRAGVLAVADLPGGLAGYVGVGVVITALTQSSSAAIAIVLTAAASGMLPFPAAAAAIIGANVGTTTTAMLAALRATANARRLAAAHVIFNVATACVALVLLPVMLAAVRWLADVMEVEGDPAALLALFHTVFNVLGVLLMLPLTAWLARWLEGRFRNAEDDLARPRHLDRTLQTTPALAADAVRGELLRLCAGARAVVQAAIDGRHDVATARAAAALEDAIRRYIAEVRTAGMPRAVADELAHSMHVARLVDEAVALAPAAAGLPALLAVDVERFAARDADLRRQAVAAIAPERKDDTAFHAFRETARGLRADILDAVITRALDVETADAALDALAALRRMVKQLGQATQMLAAPGSRADAGSHVAEEAVPEP